MSNDLEQRYRHALRWYPKRWRLQHQAALLGLLLDQAEAEGRTEMSPADRNNLARHGLAHRLTPIGIGVLLLLAALSAAEIISLLTSKTGLGASLLFVPPRFPAVPVGGSWTPPFILQFDAWALYLVCVVLLLGSLAGTVLLARSRRHNISAS